MSTHALIGVATDYGFKAKFVHYDGYPEYMMPAIKDVIKNSDSFAHAVEKLTANHWTDLVNVPSANHDQDWYTNGDIDHSYLYILDDNEVRCYIPNGDTWTRLMPEDVLKVNTNA
jgi:hypothetical protein